MTLPGVDTREEAGKPREPLVGRLARRSVAMGVRELTVPGTPMPMTRPRFNRTTGYPYRDDKRAARKGDFAQAWLDAGLAAFDRELPLACELEFVFARPASHYGTGRNAGILKPRFLHARPAGGANGGDFDNLAKLVTDALEGVAFQNDAQIADAHVVKRYAGPGEVPHTRIALRPLVA